MTDNSEDVLFEKLVSDMRSSLPQDIVDILSGADKGQAVMSAFCKFGFGLRAILNLDAEGASEKWFAVLRNSGTGPLLGFNGEGAVFALFEYVWDKMHESN
ncbi:hypothetical protein [Achromobacter marplatensis]